jgi:hypothetical protein
MAAVPLPALGSGLPDLAAMYGYIHFERATAFVD